MMHVFISNNSKKSFYENHAHRFLMGNEKLYALRNRRAALQVNRSVNDALKSFWRNCRCVGWGENRHSIVRWFPDWVVRRRRHGVHIAYRIIRLRCSHNLLYLVQLPQNQATAETKSGIAHNYRLITLIHKEICYLIIFDFHHHHLSIIRISTSKLFASTFSAFVFSWGLKFLQRWKLINCTIS